MIVGTISVNWVSNQIIGMENLNLFRVLYELVVCIDIFVTEVQGLDIELYS